MKEEETEGIPSSFGIKTLLIPYFDLQMNEIVVWYILTGKKIYARSWFTSKWLRMYSLGTIY